MRRWRFPFALSVVAAAALLGFLTEGSARAQVNVTATAGTASASYGTLKAAFDAINAGTHRGVVTIGLTGNTNEGTATAAIGPSGSGATSYISVTISPSGGAARSITGATMTGNPLIDFNGADNVTIDGLDSGGNSLTISNTTASSVSGTSTIAFRNGATGNSVMRATILGSSTALAATGGTVFFGADSVTVTGNDANVIAGNRIGPAGAALPRFAVACAGSTATAEAGNSGNQIADNHVYDYFATAGASGGIYSYSGCSGFSISGNRLYQTAPRAWSATTSRHFGIAVENSAAATGAEAVAIANNIIGFASAAGSGTYTITGAAAPQQYFEGIYFSGRPGSAPSAITSNTVASLSLSGATVYASTGVFWGIRVTGGAASTNSNTIGSLTADGSIAISVSSSGGAVWAYGIDSAQGGAWNASGNSIGGISMVSSSSAVFYGLLCEGTEPVMNASGNFVGGSGTGSIQVSNGIGSGGLVGMNAACPAQIDLTDNVVRNLRMVESSVASRADLVGIIVSPSSSPQQMVSRNLVQDLSLMRAGGFTNSVVRGIVFTPNSGGSGSVLTGNAVLSLAVTGGSAELEGLRVGLGPAVVANNLVRLGIDQSGASLTAGLPIRGIWDLSSSSSSFYHNSVFVGGGGVEGTEATYAFLSDSTGSPREYANNIFVNARSNGAGAGKHYAVKLGGSGPSPAGLSSNFNLFQVTGSGGVLGSYDGVDQSTLAAWRTATHQDLDSLVGDPHFLAPTAGTPDLHIDPAVSPTPVEGNGTFIASVTEDFDGQSRAGLTPVDIGADAGSFNGTDLLKPVLSYTPLLDTGSVALRQLSVSITDASGVASGGAAPRVHYRKGAGTFVSQVCNLGSGSSTSGTWTCPLDPAGLGGVAPGDLISYFVLAQDVATPPNVGSSPVGAEATDVSTVLSLPFTLSSYTILPAVSGTKSVCASGCDYTTLTGVGGVFAALDAGAIMSDVVIEIASDLTSGEDGSVALGPLFEDPPGSNFSVRIYPVGAPRVITSTAAPAGGFIRLRGADRVTLDGSLGGVGTDRSLTITDTSTSSTGAVIWLHDNGGDGATQNAVKNLVVVGQSSLTTYAGIGLGGSTVGTNGTGNNDNRIENNDIRRVRHGIYALGASAGSPSTGNVYTRNRIAEPAPNGYGKIGIYVGFESGAQITGNLIDTPPQAPSQDLFGISLGLTSLTTASATGNDVLAANVTGNVVRQVVGGPSVSAVGIAAWTAGGSATIANNFVAGISTKGDAGHFAAGVALAGGGGLVLFNSIAMNASLTGGAGSVFAVALSYPAIATVWGNALSATGSNGTGKHYALGLVSAANTAGLQSDFNDLHVTPGGGNYQVAKYGSLGAGGIDATTLNAWRSASGSKDIHSVSTNPLFVSATDLHLTVSSPLLMAGFTRQEVTDDIDGDPRPAVLPDIGADEVVQSADLAITKSDGVASIHPGGTVIYTVTATNAAGPLPAPSAGVADSFPAGCTAVSWTCVPAGGASCAASGNGDIADVVNLPIGGSVAYTATCTVSSSATGTLDNTATVSVSPGMTDPTSTNNSATDSDGIVPSADLSITKTDGVTTATAGGSVTYTIVASNAGPSNAPSSVVTDTFPSSLTCSTTCSGSGGGTCTAGPFSTNINDTVNLPSGASVTYTSVCTVSVNATGSIRNTATVATGSGVTDPTPSNNSATDEDVIPGTALFSDGFETGNTSRWGGAQTLFHAYQVMSVSGSTIEAGYDLAGLPGFAFESSAIAEVAGEGGQAMFRLVARRTDANAAVELSLEVVGGGSSAWVAASGSQLRFDWTAGSEGHVALAIDGRLALWVAGFATSATPATLELRRSE